MEYKDFWGFTNVNQESVQYTNEIFAIMDHQCKMLLRHTDNNVFGVFGEIKNDSSLTRAISALATAVKGTSDKMEATETVDGLSTKELKDADSFLRKKRYAFEICNEVYKFRVFTMLIAPIFPVEMVVHAEIFDGIADRIEGIAELGNVEGSIIIPNMDAFETILQMILMTPEVHFIVTKLEKEARDIEAHKDDEINKIIICEGRTDEVILMGIAQKVKKTVAIIKANGGIETISQVFSSLKEKAGTMDIPDILIIVDSDGDEDGVRNLIVSRIGCDGYELVVVNNCIEDWFTSKVANFGKLKLMQSIRAIIDEVDFDELSRKHDSFAQLINFLNK